MNIDLWESAAALWVGWCRGCTIVQQNWRFTGEIPQADSLVARFYADADAAYSLDAESFEQFVHSSELDALGLLFHADGVVREMVVAEASANQYPSIHKAMLKKFLRAVVCCLAVAPAAGMSITLAFIGPNLSDYAVAELRKAAKAVHDFCEKHEGLVAAGIHVRVSDLFLGDEGMRGLAELLCSKAPAGGVGNKSNPFAQALNLYRCCRPNTEMKLPPIESPSTAKKSPTPTAKNATPTPTPKAIRNAVRRRLSALRSDGLLSQAVRSNLCQTAFCRKKFGSKNPILRDVRTISGAPKLAQLYNATCKLPETDLAVLLDIPMEVADAVNRWADALIAAVPEKHRALYRELTEKLALRENAPALGRFCNPAYCAQHLRLPAALLKRNTPKARSEGIYETNAILLVHRNEYLMLRELPEELLPRLRELLHPAPTAAEQAEPTPAEPPKPTTKASVSDMLRPLLQACSLGRVRLLCDADFCRDGFGVSHPILKASADIPGPRSCLYYKEKYLLHGTEFRLYAHLTEKVCALLSAYLRGEPVQQGLNIPAPQL